MLFQPLTLRCGLVLPNRIALAPMTNSQSHADGLLGDDELAFLARRADGGFGMIETCASYVALDGKAWAGELGDRSRRVHPRPYSPRHAAPRRRRDGIVQLFHGGVRARASSPASRRGARARGPRTTPGFDTPRTGDRRRHHARDWPVRRRGRARRGRRLRRRRAARRARLSALAVPVAHDEPAHRRLGRRFVGRARLVREVMQAVPRGCRRGSASACGSRSRTAATREGIDLDENLQVARGSPMTARTSSTPRCGTTGEPSAKYPDRQHPAARPRRGSSPRSP